MGYFHYIARDHARFRGFNGEVDIPKGEKVDGDGVGLIAYQGKYICYYSSENAKAHFVQNDDGMGEIRAELVNSILSSMSKNDGKLRTRLNRVASDDICASYIMQQYTDCYVMWKRRFYDAPIDDLKYIASVVSKED